MSKKVTLEKLAKDFPELLNEPGSKYAGGISSMTCKDCDKPITPAEAEFYGDICAKCNQETQRIEGRAASEEWNWRNDHGDV